MAINLYHLPGKGEQMIRYDGHYGNLLRGKRRKAGKDDEIERILRQLFGSISYPVWSFFFGS